VTEKPKLDSEKLEQIHKTMRFLLENVQKLNEELFGIRFPTGTEEDRLKLIENQLDDLSRIFLSQSRRVTDLSQECRELRDELRGPDYENPGKHFARLESRVAQLEETVRKLAGKA
jgi:DNA repair ATPase RecN